MRLSTKVDTHSLKRKKSPQGIFKNRSYLQLLRLAAQGKQRRSDKTDKLDYCNFLQQQCQLGTDHSYTKGKWRELIRKAKIQLPGLVNALLSWKTGLQIKYCLNGSDGREHSSKEKDERE